MDVQLRHGDGCSLWDGDVLVLQSAVGEDALKTVGHAIEDAEGLVHNCLKVGQLF